MVLQNAFPATLVFSQLSALPPPGVTCRSLLFAAPPANPLAQISQLTSLQRFAASLSLLPLFCRGAPFIFNRLQTLFAKHGEWGAPHSGDSAQLGALHLLVAFLRDAPARYILRASFTRGFHD